MSAEALRCVADVFERWNRGDYAGAAALFAGDAEWQTRLDAFGGAAVSGADALEAMFRRVTEDLNMTVDFRHMEPIGERVLVEVFASGRGDTDPIEEWFQVFSFGEGKISHVAPFATYEEAAAAAAA